MMANGKWAVIVGNGYNSDAGEAKIFIIYVEEGADGSWDVGDWVELGTGVTGDNGMNAPVVADLDGDFIADRIYAGDLKGNLWVYDVTDSSDSNWQSAYVDGLGAPEPLFTAKDSSGVAQPITSRPLITINPDTATSGNGVNVLAYFGTGKFIEQSDFTDSQNQSFYAVWDRGTDSLDRSDLEVRTIAAAVATDDDGNTFDTRTVSGNEVTWWNGTSGEYGWYMDFLETGERLTVSPAIFANNIFMLTSVPSSAACSNGGQGWVMSVSTSGLPSNQPPYDINDDGVTDEDDYGYIGNPILTGLPSGSSFIGTSESVVGEESCRSLLQVYSDSQGNLTNEYLQLCSNAVGRMSWQEMLVH
jgi:type IV pilus assembly protein PilY1